MGNSGEHYNRTMIGNYLNKLDDKGRLTMPSKFRNELGESIVISYGFDNTLEIRTIKAFEEWSNSLIAKGNLSSTARQLQRMILGNSFEVTLDKAGRALLPKVLIQVANLKKEVALVGIGNKIEVHDADQWNSMSTDSNTMTKTLEELAEEMSKSE